MAAWQMVKNVLKKLDPLIEAVTVVCVPYFINKHLKIGIIRQEVKLNDNNNFNF